MSYEAQDILTDPARPSAEAWRTVAGIVLLAVGTLVLTALWIALVPVGARGPQGPGATPEGMIWLLGSFLCPLLVLAFVMLMLHRRRLLSLAGPLGLAGRQFRVVLMAQLAVLGLAMVLPSPEGMDPVAQLAVLGLAMVLPSPEGMDPVAHLPVEVWLRWLVPALVLLVVQVGAEELVFRGYLQSQLAARVGSPLVWLGAPALLFAALHLDPAAGANGWPVVGVTLLFALAAGDLTARCGTLGPAMAMHLVNNAGALLLVGATGPMQGLALYLMPVDMADPALLPMLAVEAMLIVIAWLGARLALRV